MVIFKSIIALDLETTSLPEMDHNTTKITELAIIGCEVEHLKNSKNLPRVLHKLVLLFNPNKVIHPEATEVTGLSNGLLSNVKAFSNKDVEVLRVFIDRLPPPVCIVAHNGNKFDFPILRRALNRVNMELQNNVYCIDSFQAFQKLLPTITPLKRSKFMTPPHQTSQPSSEAPHKKVAKELFPDDEALSQWSMNLENELLSYTPKSYKLGDIYQYFFKGKYQNQHSAEADSQALLSCIMLCDGFIEWMNQNAIVFNSIPPLS